MERPPRARPIEPDDPPEWPDDCKNDDHLWNRNGICVFCDTMKDELPFSAEDQLPEMPKDEEEETNRTL